MDRIAPSEKDAITDTLEKGVWEVNPVTVAGESTSRARDIDHDAIARRTIHKIGYTDPAEGFNADGVRITKLRERMLKAWAKDRAAPA